MTSCDDTRTHEPDLREVTIEMDAIRDIMDERDKRYGVQFESQKESVAASLASISKAIDKAEDAQRDYNERSNEFRAALDDAQKLMLSRTEADQRFAALNEKLDASGRSQIGLFVLLGLALMGDLIQFVIRK